jgi:ABC-type multidrug transport system ATPase subunit
MIATTELTKRFKSIVAVDQVELNVRPGDIYGFLGANGSGKTTTVRMLLGLVLPTSGSVRLLGEPMPKAARRVLPRVGALVEGPSAYRHLSGHTHLSLLDSMGSGGTARTRKDRVEEALAQVGLAGVDGRPVKAYSLGMRQRLGLAAALMRSPELLILDEPTNGLDPQGILEIRELLQKLNADGVTIFLSSHLLAEVEQLCSRVGVLDHGSVVLESDMAALRAPTGRIIVHTRDVRSACGLLGTRVTEHDQTSVTVLDDDAARLNTELVGAGIAVDALIPERRTLEQVILEATGPSPDRIDRPHR